MGFIFRTVALAALGLGIPLMGPLHETSQQLPTFRASTELVLVETQVVGRDGSPIQGLKADQFEVFIDGRRRPVVSAEFTGAKGAAPARDGRVIVLAIDQASFPSAARPSAQEAATRVVDRVATEDYLGMIAFPGSVEIAPTRDRAAIRAGIEKISGLRVDTLSPRFNISANDAVALKSRESVTTKEIVDRACRSDFGNPSCRQEVMQDGSRIADTLDQQGMISINGLHGVVDAMGPLPGRKTLVVISAGLPMSSRPGSRLNADTEATRIARRAAAANINLYVFYMNVHFLSYFSAAYGKGNHSIFEDISLFGNGLEKLADSGGGTFFQVEVDSDPFVDRMLRETSAYYLLGVESEPSTHDGREHFIRVAVKQKGASLRYRRSVTIPRSAK